MHRIFGFMKFSIKLNISIIISKYKYNLIINIRIDENVCESFDNEIQNHFICFSMLLKRRKCCIEAIDRYLGLIFPNYISKDFMGLRIKRFDIIYMFCVILFGTQLKKYSINFHLQDFGSNGEDFNFE